MRRFCTILHIICLFRSKRCIFLSIFHVIPSFCYKKFGFLGFLFCQNIVKSHISTDYAVSYSHFPQLFPQVSTLAIWPEIGKTPHSRRDTNFLYSNEVRVCIFLCIFMHCYEMFHKLCKKCRSVLTLLHLLLKGLPPEWIWWRRH